LRRKINSSMENYRLTGWSRILQRQQQQLLQLNNICCFLKLIIYIPEKYVVF